MKPQLLGLILLLGLMAVPAVGADAPPQQEVLIRLVTNASTKPPGPVENDLPSNVVEACGKLLKMMGEDPKKTHEHLASDYKGFSVEGTLTPLYTNEKAALMSVPIKLDAATLKSDDLPLNPDGSPGFGENVGGCMYLNDKKINPDGQVIGTFCFVLENGAWKVHNYYVSNSALHPDEIAFLKKQLDEYAAKH